MNSSVDKAEDGKYFSSSSVYRGKSASKQEQTGACSVFVEREPIRDCLGLNTPKGGVFRDKR